MTRRAVVAAAGLLAVAVLSVGLATFLRSDDPGDPPERPDPTTPSTETLEQQIDRVAAVVEAVRELQFDAVPKATVVTPDDLAERVAQELQAYTPEDAAEDERILVALGVLDPGEDLRALIIRGYSEQVAGYYDPETGQLVVGATDPSQRLGRIEEIILAHELQHALADESLGLPEIPDDTEGREDAVLARQALTEGDATVSMQLYIEEGFSVVDQLLLPAELGELTEQLAGFTELPHYVQRSFTFPYEEGAVFVSSLRGSGGWEAVDRAYLDPPTTTGEVLFPERYPAAETLPVAAPKSPGSDWELVRETTFGAADLLFLFEAPGDDPLAALASPLAAAEAWRGGRLHLFADGRSAAVGIALSTDDLPTLCAALGEWYDRTHDDDRGLAERAGTRRWEGGRWHAALRCENEHVQLGIAPSAEVAAALAGG